MIHVKWVQKLYSLAEVWRFGNLKLERKKIVVETEQKFNDIQDRDPDKHIIDFDYSITEIKLNKLNESSKAQSWYSIIMPNLWPKKIPITSKPKICYQMSKSKEGINYGKDQYIFL